MSNVLNQKFSSYEDSMMWAQIIAFAPFMFQTAKTLRDLNVLKTLKSEQGTSFETLRTQTKLSDYSLSVLLDAGYSSGLLIEKDKQYFITAAGTHIANDPLTKVNMNFTNDVCYEGLPFLEDSLKNDKPEGLKVFGNWKTIYENLTKLPEPALKSWLEFDHFYSDDAFPRALSFLFQENPKKILDVGGNTGKFAMASVMNNPNVSVTMLDHPKQLEIAGENIRKRGLENRIERIAMDLLDHSKPFPKGHDIIWMSQFLDCFSKEDILQLFRRAHAAMSDTTSFFIMETFIDRQRYEAARFCLDMTSLYFTCFANGNSRMYRATDFIELLDQAGLKVVEDHDNIRVSHTLLKCKRK